MDAAGVVRRAVVGEAAAEVTVEGDAGVKVQARALGRRAFSLSMSLD